MVIVRVEDDVTTFDLYNALFGRELFIVFSSSMICWEDAISDVDAGRELKPPASRI